MTIRIRRWGLVLKVSGSTSPPPPPPPPPPPGSAGGPSNERRVQVVSVATDSLVGGAGGELLGVFSKVLQGRVREGLDGTERATVMVDPLESAWTHVLQGRVIVLEYTNGDWEEFRIAITETQRTPEGLLVGLIEGQGLGRYDLRHRAGLFESFEADGFADLDHSRDGLTPTEWADEIASSPDFPSYISQGNIGSSGGHRLVLAANTPLDAFQQLEEVSGLEFSVRRSSTDYRYHLETERGSTYPKAFLHGFRNVTRLRHRSDALQQATRVYPFGGGPDGSRVTMGGNQWDVTAVTTGGAGTIDMSSDTIGKPIAFDDQLNGLAIRKVGSTDAPLSITDSAVTNQRLTLGAGHGISTTDIVQIIRDTSGRDLTYLEHPARAASTAYGQWTQVADRPDFPPVNNLFTDNPFCQQFTAGAPVGFATVGSTATALTKNGASTGGDKSRIKHGSASIKVVSTGAGNGIQTAVINHKPSPSRPFVTAQVELNAELLSTTNTFVKVQLEDVTNGVLYPSSDVASSRMNIIDRFDRLDLQPGVNFDAEGADQFRIRVTTDGGDGTFYVDGVQLSDRATPAQGIVNGRIANALWHEALQVLRDDSLPADTFDLDLIDLHSLDTVTFAHDELAVGGTVVLVGEEEEIDVETRIVEIDRNILEPGDVRIQLSKKQDDLIGRIRGTTRQPVRDGSRAAGNSFLPPIATNLDQVSDGATYLRVGGVNASNQITASSISANAVTAGKIAANAVTATEINVATLSAISANAGTLTAGTISAGVLFSGAIETSNLDLYGGNVRITGLGSIGNEYTDIDENRVRVQSAATTFIDYKQQEIEMVSSNVTVGTWAGSEWDTGANDLTLTCNTGQRVNFNGPAWVSGPVGSFDRYLPIEVQGTAAWMVLRTSVS